MMTQFIDALRRLWDALRDKPERADIVGVTTVFTTPSDAEAHSRPTE